MAARADGLVGLRLLFTLVGVSVASFGPWFVLILRDRGLAADSTGAIVAVMALAGAVASPVWGRLTDRWLGTRHALQVASVTSAALAIALVWGTRHVVLLLAIAALLGATRAPVDQLADVLALGALGRDATTAAYGRIRSWNSAGFAVSAGILGLIFSGIGLNGWTFAFYAAVLLLIPVSARPLHGTPIPVAREVPSTGGRPTAVVLLLTGVFLVFTATTGAVTFIPLRISGQGGSLAIVGLAAAAGAAAEVPTMWLNARLRPRAQESFAIATALYVALLVGWALASDAVTIALLSVVEGVAFGFFYVAAVTSIAGLLPLSARSTGQGLLQAVYKGVSPVTGAAVGGVIYAAYGAAALFAGAAACVVAGAAVITYALSRSEDQPNGCGPAHVL